MSNSDRAAPAASIFICYRRADSSYITDRIHDWLDREFPEAVFRDVDAIPFGVDFRQYIRQVLDTCRIMLVVIGPEWLTVTSDSGGRRIDDPRDHVRIEIETALAHGDVLVIPLLVRDAKVPSPKDLPPAIQALAFRNGPSIRRDPDFKTDMDRLIRQMRRALEQSPAPVSHPPPPSPMPDEIPAAGEPPSVAAEQEPVRNFSIPPSGRRAPGTIPTARWVIAAFILVLLVLGGVFLVKQQQKHTSSSVVDAPTPEPVESPATPSAVTPEPAHSPTAGWPVPDKPWENSLGMRFVPVPGTQVLFSVWETRVRDFEAFVEATGHDPTDGRWRDSGFEQTGDHPVVNVSWEDAQAFCKWLTDKEQKAGRIGPDQEYRLPTDHEWSCAVGIGDLENPDQTPEEKNAKIPDVYPWGKDWPPPVGAGNYAGSEAKGDGYPRTSPVGSFNKNRVGIYDLGGNVLEWCDDKYNPSDTPRVLRGASWSSRGPILLRSSFRFHARPDFLYVSRGFRCVVVLETPATPSAVTSEPARSPTARWPAPDKPWENSLGMKFVPVKGTEVLFSVWETRVRDFEAFVDATGYDATGGAYTLGSDGWEQKGGSWKSPGFDQTGDHPVVCVSWKDAQAFCKWLTDKERKAGRIGPGQEYRLPTDHEWSCAVGIGDLENPDQTPEEKDTKIQDVYPWGKDWPPPVGAGNYAGSEAKTKDWPSGRPTISGYDDGYARTSAVGSFNGNGFGIYDLGGNVWEWCEDKYKASENWRVLRGASWNNDAPGILLSSYRYLGVPPVSRGGGGGFRCVVVVESSR